MSISIRCPRCKGRKIVEVDIQIGTDGGWPLFDRATVECPQCEGNGHLAFARRSSPSPTARGTWAVPSQAGRDRPPNIERVYDHSS